MRLINSFTQWFLLSIIPFVIISCGGTSQKPYTTSNQVPVSSQHFLNNPDNFQFVVIGDRTGGHRPGVYEKAVEKINYLQPEFVMSMGDLIEGYTEDQAALNAQWDEFKQITAKLQMPLFYVVGNHDISNNTMQSIWQQRNGDDYYSFVYNNVLFIALNTEDPAVELPKAIQEKQLMLEQMMATNAEQMQQRILANSSNHPDAAKLPGSVHISDAQLAFVEKTLQQHPSVRWTMLFMHKPAWMYDDPQFAKIEQLLASRPYTVIAGHEHYYHYSKRNGRDYIDMATTGGIWLKDGPGRFDHLLWVTLTDNGPVFGNIMLDAIYGLAVEPVTPAE
ncbi:metallophosphoesterase family protein [Halioxenophilus sp. WMMB6]|uniref:metallophosphoesterase family protein n=1 Tax=Halioxenophilus sp. WMMB6 TaxID=3073815 RepID=UPI00295EF8E9|nr:metallophosphoesterase [Halioxenophilus sp. WMMB6]